MLGIVLGSASLASASANASPSAPRDDERIGVVLTWPQNAHGELEVLRRRLIAELQLRGVEVWHASHATPENGALLGHITLRHDPAVEPPTVEWTPRSTGATHHVLVGDSEVAAVQTAELVIATLEAEPARPPQPQPPSRQTPPPPPPSVASPEPPRWRAEIGMNALGSPGGLGLVAGPHLGASLALDKTRRFGVGLDLTASAVLARTNTSQSQHRIGLAALRTHALWWPRPRGRIGGVIGVGAGSLVGWARPGPTTAVGLLGARGDFTVALGTRVAVWLGGRVDIALPKIEVRSGADAQATAGQPLLDIGLGLQFRG